MTISPPTSAFDDTPSQCVTINKEWISHIVGLIDRASKERYWDTGDQYAATQEIEKIILAFTLGNCEASAVTDYIHVQHLEASNDDGGNSGSNRGLLITDIASNLDPLPVIDFLGGIINIPSGLWHVSGYHIFRADSDAEASLLVREWPDTSEFTYTEYAGASMEIPAGKNTVVPIDVVFEHVEGAFSAVQLRINICSVAQSGNGLGEAIGQGTEVYGQFMFTRIG